MGGAKRHRKILMDTGSEEDQDDEEDDDDDDGEDDDADEEEEDQTDVPGASGGKRRRPGTNATVSKRQRVSTPPTVESLARSQHFNGSFPLSAVSEFLNTPSPAAPLSLSLIFPNANGTDEAAEQESIWSTVVVVVYLRTRFVQEREAWEVMEEKAIEYIRVILGERGLADGDMGALIDSLCEEAQKFM